jgi:hypothetical protein
MNDLSREILSDIIVNMKYSRYLDDKKRRESWEEICYRNMSMHISKFPKLIKEIEFVYKEFVFPKKVLPSMRSLQFGGKPIELNNSRIYNCTYSPAKDIKFFSELMFLLLGGSGCGYSVQRHHINQIPPILTPNKNRKFVIEDSIAGWADAIKVLFKSYTQGNSKPIFDFSQIRPKGTRLITAGGKAPGPSPLRKCITELQNVLEGANGRKLTSLEVHQMSCYIADAVLAGGIRRASLISFFDLDDVDMLTCKSGNWWELHPEFARCNNSAVLERGKITYEQFLSLWDRIKESGSGEPGVIWVNNKEVLGNPCFSYETPILTKDGYKKIGELENKTIELINYKGEIVSGTIFKSGVKRILKLNLTNHTSIRTTENHRFMLVDGSEKESQFLVKNDRLMPYFKINQEITEYTKYGFIQGDGNLGRLDSKEHLGLEVCIGEKDLEVGKLFGVDKTADHYLSGYNIILKDLGFSANSLPTRILPTTIKDWSIDDKRMFLKGLWSANGSIISGYRIAFKSTCKQLITELQELLKEFNIESYYTTNKAKEVHFSNGDYTCKESYDLNIAQYESILKFAELIGFIHTYKQESLKQLILIKAPKIKTSIFQDEEDVYDFSLSDDTHWGVINGIIAHNCLEISLSPYGVCNLTEINSASIESQEDFNNRCYAASFLGTLQASYTDFYYIRDNWIKTAEDESLLGVSMTGIASNSLNTINIKEGVSIVKETNDRISSIIGINSAKRLTTIKPAGTSSLVLGCSSGIHAYHSPYYIRRIRVGKNEAIYSYLKSKLPELIEDDYFRPHDTAIICIPQKSPDNAIIRTESALDLLERSKKLYNDWILPGHISGDSTHNISITVSIKPEEWNIIGEWMWINKGYYNGISVLPYDGGTYKQPPFEECSKETFEEMYSHLKQIDLNEVIEDYDNTNLIGEIACGGKDSCEIN